MVNCYLKTLKWSYNRIKNRDIFRQSISLTYKGGITTILIFILLRMMFNRSDVTWNQNTLREDLSKDTSPIILSSEDPEFYVSWNVYDKLNTFGVNKEKAVAEEYTHYYSYNDNSVESTLTNITDFECNPDTTPDYLVEDVLCPNWKGLSFHGNDANPTKSFLQASYYRQI